MRLPSSVAVCLIVLTGLNACTSGGDRRHGMRGSGGGAMTSGELYSRAMSLKASGRCEAAERPLMHLAKQGGGFEIAQFHLGECMLIRTAQRRGPERELLIKQGLYWLELSANSGEPKAQALLVETLVDEASSTLDIQAAATWYLIFQDNSKRTFLEIVEIDARSTETLFRLATEEDWKHARVKARAWSRILQEVKVPDAGFPASRATRPDGRKKGRGSKGDGKHRRFQQHAETTAL